jgi:hypothetical protein
MLMQKQDVEAGSDVLFADHNELWRRVAFYVDRLLRERRRANFRSNCRHGSTGSEFEYRQVAVFRLKTNSKRVDCTTGKSAGLSPSSIRAR